MKEFTVTVLGSSAATATEHRNLTSHLINYCGRLYMIDCGEGTQFRLRQLRVKPNRIRHIFISHLHGDHFFGLIGMISTMHLMRRTEALTIYGPPKLQEIIDLQLEASETRLYYSLHFVATHADSMQTILDDGKLTVSSFPLTHRIPTTGFIFREKEQPRHIDKAAADSYKVPVSYYENLKQGADYINDSGELIANTVLTLPGDTPRSYAFCSDTVYDEGIIKYVKGANLLYHEATFMHDLHETASDKMHSTNIQAASIAKKAGADRLLMGHFSARYEDLGPFLSEAQSVFPNSVIAEEGSTYEVGVSET